LNAGVNKYSYHLIPASNRSLIFATTLFKCIFLQYQFQSLLEHTVGGGPVVPQLPRTDVAADSCSVPSGHTITLDNTSQETCLRPAVFFSFEAP